MYNYKITRNIISTLFVSVIFLSSCKTNIEPEKPSKGDADFTTYVSIGNSLTAGYADGTLYKSGQENSYPNMLAAQFRMVGGGDFTQPLLPGNYGWPNRKLELGYSTDCLGNVSLAPLGTLSGVDTNGSSTNISNQGPFNNVGIPGIKCAHFGIPGYGMLNPYARRFFSNLSIQTPREVALSKVPTFFSIWLGSNDVLAYATSGGQGSVGGIGINDISPVALFKQEYETLVEKITMHGAKGILINIPDITSTPFFTTINPKGLNLTQQQATQLTSAYAALGLNHVTFEAGDNYFVIQDDQVGARKMKQGEYLILTVPGDSLKCGGWGSLKPIPGQYVLDEEEVANIQLATKQFNDIIVSAAEKFNLAFMDANEFLRKSQSGFMWDGVNYTPQFVTGGIFSLDGIHLTPRGNAIVANEVIRVINQKYRSTISYVDVNKYNGILFP